MEQLSLPLLKTASTILTWATFWLAITTAVLGWAAAQVRSETGRRADLRVATAEQGAAEASSAAALANERTELLRSDNLGTQERLIDAERKLAAEQAARVELEKRVAARRLTAVQNEVFDTHLQHHVFESARPTIAVFSTTETGEAALFAKSLAEAISECGFEINRNHVHYGKGYHLQGVGVLTSTDPAGIALGQTFLEGFLAAGIAAHLLPPREAAPYPGDHTDEGTKLFNMGISIMVGDRPS